MGLTLESLVADLEKQAGFVPESDEDKAKKKDDDEGKKDEDKKEDKKEEKEKKEGEQEKSASFKTGSDLAKEIMEKVASTKIEQTNKDTGMNKQASDAGKALAQALLTKLAGVGDVITENGIPAGVVPNKTQVDLAQQVAEHNNSFQPTPGTDGKGNGGTINEIFDAIVADAQARTNAATIAQTPSTSAEGAINNQAPAQVQVDESQEKMAAAVALVNSGIDFDTAIDMVKAASAEIEAEEEAQIKQAAFNELLDQGVDFDLAVAMVKQAGALTSVGGRAAAVAGKKGMSMGKKVAIGAAAAGTAGAAGYAYKKGQEKKAALDALIENGIDFDEAVAYVSQM
jgi:hypothetical protein